MLRRASLTSIVMLSVEIFVLAAGIFLSANAWLICFGIMALVGFDIWIFIQFLQKFEWNKRQAKELIELL